MINFFTLFVFLLLQGSGLLSAMTGAFWGNSDSDSSSVESTPVSSLHTSPLKSGFSSGSISPMIDLSPFTSPSRDLAQALGSRVTLSPQSDVEGFLFGTPSPSPENSPLRSILYNIPKEAFLATAALENRYFSDEINRRKIRIKLGENNMCLQLRLDFMHFTYPEIRLQDGMPVLNGFHMDPHFSLYYRGLYILNNQQRINQHGVYSAEVIVRGHNVGTKTFFPNCWENRDLTNALLNALQNISADSINRLSNNRVKFFGITNDGLMIHFIINPNDGQIVTAYPDTTIELQEEASLPLARVLFE